MPCRPWTRVAHRAHRAHRMDRMGRMDARCRGIDAARSATNRNARHGRPVHVIIMPGFLIPSTAPDVARHEVLQLPEADSTGGHRGRWHGGWLVCCGWAISMA